MLANAKFCRSTVKHGTQNIHNDCHHDCLTALKCTKFVFGRAPPRAPLHGGVYSAPPDPTAGLRGSYF